MIKQANLSGKAGQAPPSLPVDGIGLSPGEGVEDRGKVAS